MSYETVLRSYFDAWSSRDWSAAKEMLAPVFTFTSPYDDHIGIDRYKPRCWDTIESIGEFEFVRIVVEGNDAFVRYRNEINGSSVQNTEHFRFEKGKITEVTVFFGRPEQ